MADHSEEQTTENRSAVRESACILSTKLYIPPARANAVRRPDLVERLLSSTGRPDSFALVSGPAGSGKSTLLSEFVTRCPQPAAWVSLDKGDNDPIQFWTYVITACQSLLGGVGETALELLGTAQLPADVIPTLLINDLTAQELSIVLILDDYHEIQNPGIHAGLSFLLEHLPPNFHVIISTRVDPPWPLVRYRARNQLVEIRAQDLRFTFDEAARFLNHTMGLALSVEDAAALEGRTEGWVAGLQLAALSLQGRADTAAFIRAFTGSHVYIAEYLIAEILQAQPEDLQLFLLQTAILERLNAGLCEAVTGCPDGQSLLLDLHRANIFIIPLDSEAGWFRYHHLFADLLRARLQGHFSADEVAALHLRASGWYERGGFVVEAVSHALAARDFERAAALVDRVGRQMMTTEQYMILRGWLDALPAESFDAHPRLEIYRVLIDLNLGTMDMYEQTLLEKERLIKSLPSSPENDALRREAMVYLSLLMAHQNTARAARMAEEALAEVPEADVKLRAYLYSALYRAYGMDGDIEKSAPAYRECLRLALAAGQYAMIADTTMVRAFDLCQYGRLDEAAHDCQEILDAGAQLKRKVFYPAGIACIGLAGIHLERYDLETAEEYLTHGLDLCRQGGTYGLYTGYVQKARLHQAKGEFEAAAITLQTLEQTLQRRDFTLTARQVSLRLAMGDIDGASRLEAPLLEILGGGAYSQQLPLIAAEAFKLSLVRIYIAQERITEADQLLDEVGATVEPGRRLGRLIEVHMLRALAQQKQAGGQTSLEALTCLERALELAEPPGFVLLLLEEGPALIPLLSAAADYPSASDQVRRYARRLLSAFAGPGRSVGSAPGLVEPLTPREIEVLRLIATGDSNQVIAGKLFITVRTVKKHMTGILGKLDAANRTQAVAHARDLGLLDRD